MKILEINNPNLLYELLLNILEENWNNIHDEFADKKKSCLTKLLSWLTKNLSKLYIHLEVKGFLTLLNKYYVKYLKIPDIFYIKFMRTILSETVKIFGNSIYDYYEFMDMD